MTTPKHSPWLLLLSGIVLFYGCGQDFRDRPLREIHAMSQEERQQELAKLSSDERDALEAAVMANLKDTMEMKKKTINQLIDEGRRIEAERDTAARRDSGSVNLK